MAKRKAKPAIQSSTAPSASASSHPRLAMDLKTDPIIGYKLRVLLYDLRNMRKDRASEDRTLRTTHPTSISGPYFTAEEADVVLNATAMVMNEDKKHEDGEQPGDEQPQDNPLRKEATKNAPYPQEMTVEQAINTRLENFFEKRKASGDARPCGPHNMAPIYEELFGISKEELQNDDKFLGRLRRCGLDSQGMGFYVQGGISSWQEIGW